VGNLENLIRHAIAIKNELGVELYSAFEYVYFCGENCKALFNLNAIKEKLEINA
jgi:hypothetical protein